MAKATVLNALEDSLLYNPTYGSDPKAQSIVRVQLPWHGHQHDAIGELKPGFLLVGRRVLVPLANVRPPLPDDGGTEIWIDVNHLRPASIIETDLSADTPGTSGIPDLAGAINAADIPDDTEPSFILRSHIHELPGDQRRDYALRTLSVTLSRFVGSGGTRVALSSGVGDMMELAITIDVLAVVAGGDGTTTVADSGTVANSGDDIPRVGMEDGRTGVSYLWKFRQATRPGTDRSALWVSPRPPFATANLVPNQPKSSGHRKGSDQGEGNDAHVDRARAAHHIGQLPLWLTTRRFWSVFRWHRGRLQHILQFSVPDKFRRTLMWRFQLRRPTSDPEVRAGMSNRR